jgi:hypothetical protein
MGNKKQEVFQKNNILKIKKFDVKNIAILFERITKVIIVANKYANLLNH